MSSPAPLLAATAALLCASVASCKDVSRFSTAPGESYCGSIIEAPFVRAGFGPGVQMRMTFDADHQSDRPGTIATDDGLLADAPLRPLPQLSHDPLSTLQFGEGRDKNLLYAADPKTPSSGPTLLAVLSFMHDGTAEVRLVRGAPPTGDTRSMPVANGDVLFGVFILRRESGRCGF